MCEMLARYNYCHGGAEGALVGMSLLDIKSYVNEFDVQNATRLGWYEICSGSR